MTHYTFYGNIYNAIHTLVQLKLQKEGAMEKRRLAVVGVVHEYLKHNHGYSGLIELETFSLIGEVLDSCETAGHSIGYLVGVLDIELAEAKEKDWEILRKKLKKLKLFFELEAQVRKGEYPTEGADDEVPLDLAHLVGVGGGNWPSRPIRRGRVLIKDSRSSRWVAARFAGSRSGVSVPDSSLRTACPLG